MLEQTRVAERGGKDPERLADFFAPRSLAIVGASDKARWSLNAYTNLSVIEFAGRVVPVNPKRSHVFGLEAVGSLRDLATPVDLAYIATPPDLLPAILDDAEAAGIRNAVVVAAGFNESGPAGKTLQRALVEQARRQGIVLLGPNCPGFLSVTHRVAACGQQIPVGLPRGGVGVVLQSGALAAQPDQIAYILFDAPSLDLFMPSLFPPVTAPTIEALAEQLGLDPAALLATVDAFNEAVRPGTFDDTELDDCRTEGLQPPKSHWARRIETAPFYAYPVRPGITFTYLGTRVNAEARMMMTNGASASNMFAAGEIMAGNVLGEGYAAGIGMTIGAVCGRIAGREAARNGRN